MSAFEGHGTLISTIKPSWKRIVTKTDINVNSNNSSSSDFSSYEDDNNNNNNNTSLTASTKHPVCSTCLKNQGDYRCPRCDAIYCGVKCFATHNGGKCNEGFSKDSVMKEMAITQKEGIKEDGITKILQREMERNRNEEGGDDEEEEDEDEAILRSLASKLAIDQSESDLNNDSEVQTLFKSLPDHLRQDFLNSLKIGNVTAAWNPWWRPEITTSADTDSDFDSKIINTHSYNNKQQTLDDLIISCPPFKSLLPTTSQASPPNLAYNALDMIFAFAHVARLFNGDLVDCNEEAASVLLNSSTVLKNASTYRNGETTVTVILNEAIARIRSEMPNDLPNVEFSVLVEDCLLIMKGRRLVQRAFADMGVLVKGGLLRGKGKKSKAFASVAKKIDFYFAWTCSDQFDVDTKSLDDSDDQLSFLGALEQRCS